MITQKKEEIILQLKSKLDPEKYRFIYLALDSYQLKEVEELLFQAYQIGYDSGYDMGYFLDKEELALGEER